MLFGRLVGWMLIAVAVIMASADAVMALSPAEYAGIVTADVVTLLTGGAPDAEVENVSTLAQMEGLLLQLPAWVMVGAMGLGLAVAARKRPRRYRFRR